MHDRGKESVLQDGRRHRAADELGHTHHKAVLSAISTHRRMAGALLRLPVHPSSIPTWYLGARSSGNGEYPVRRKSEQHPFGT